MTLVARLTATPPPNVGSGDASAAPPQDGAAFGSILSEIGGHADQNGKSASARSAGGTHHSQEDGREEKVRDGKPATRKHGLAGHLIADGGRSTHVGKEAQDLADAASEPTGSDDAGAGEPAASPPAMLLVATGQTDTPDEVRIDAPESPLKQEVAGAIADHVADRAATVSKGTQPRDSRTSATGGNVERFPAEARASPPQETQPTPPPAVGDVTVLGRETHFAPARPSAATPQATQADQDDAAEETVGKEPAGRSARSPGFVPEAHATKINLTGKHSDGAPGDHDAPGPTVSGATTPATPADGGGLPSSTLHRLASAIADTAASAPSAPVAGAATVAAAPVPPAGPVKVLTVRLDLAESGTLDVRMVAEGSALTIHVRAEKDETARRLHNDRDELAALLRGAGYDANIATIESRRTDAGAPPAGQPAAAGPAVTSQGDQGGAFQEPRQQGRGGHAFPFAGERETSHDTSKPDGRGAGLLYV